MQNEQVRGGVMALTIRAQVQALADLSWGVLVQQHGHQDIKVGIHQIDTLLPLSFSKQIADTIQKFLDLLLE